MSGSIDLTTAQRVLGRDVLGPDDVRSVFDVTVPVPPIPYSAGELEAAAGADECLVLRIDRDARGPLTLLRLIERFSDAFDERFLHKMGYQLRDDWGIALEPLAAKDVCRTGWMLVRKQILDDSRNRPYTEHDTAFARYAAQVGVPARLLHHRTGVEIAYDLILYRSARGVRLLEDTWDWSSSLTVDAGYLNVGGFGERGMQILSYSPAVRHGALGVCPARLPRG